MAVNTETLLGLRKLLWQALGDYLQFATTTNIGAGTSIVSTELKSYDDGVDDYFNDWWVFIDGTTNAGVFRKVYDYATATGTLSVRGSNLTAETASRTCYFWKTTTRLHVQCLNPRTSFARCSRRQMLGQSSRWFSWLTCFRKHPQRRSRGAPPPGRRTSTGTQQSRN